MPRRDFLLQFGQRFVLVELGEDLVDGPPLGFAIACLQISIALASACLITKRKILWGVSGLLGGIGTCFLIYGLYLV